MPPSRLRHSASLIPVSGSTTYWTLLILPRETGAGPAFPEQRLDDQLPTWPTDPFLWGIRAPPASTKSEVEDYEDLCLALLSRGLERCCLFLWGGGCRRSAPCWALLKLWGQGFPTDVWLEQGEYCQKGFLLLGDPFLDLLAMGNRLFLRFSWSVPVGNSRLKASVEPCPEYIKGNKETQGTHRCAVHQVPRALGSLPSFCLSESSYACLLGYVHGPLAVWERRWEEWGYFILAVTRSRTMSGMFRRGQRGCKRPTVPFWVTGNHKAPSWPSGVGK